MITIDPLPGLTVSAPPAAASSIAQVNHLRAVPSLIVLIVRVTPPLSNEACEWSWMTVAMSSSRKSRARERKLLFVLVVVAASSLYQPWNVSDPDPALDENPIAPASASASIVPSAWAWVVSMPSYCGFHPKPVRGVQVAPLVGLSTLTTVLSRSSRSRDRA